RRVVKVHVGVDEAGGEMPVATVDGLLRHRELVGTLGKRRDLAVADRDPAHEGPVVRDDGDVVNDGVRLHRRPQFRCGITLSPQSLIEFSTRSCGRPGNFMRMIMFVVPSSHRYFSHSRMQVSGFPMMNRWRSSPSARSSWGGTGWPCSSSMCPHSRYSR